MSEDATPRDRDLLRALEERQRKQDELLRLQRELEHTNSRIVALYAELDDRAMHLRQADELKSRFHARMTHEFRAPVNSIIGLCQLLLDARAREGRKPEPELAFIAAAAQQLRALTDDLMDLARVEAGKTIVRITTFRTDALFAALRGALEPLPINPAVSLMFDPPGDVPPLETDEAKLSQILRNLISNALKFTERGEVRVSASSSDNGATVVFRVRDTGIGIAPADQARIFDEFTQLEHRLQRSLRGTGLGLPVSRRLAELLGGTLSVTSEPGVGSTFELRMPSRYPA